MTNDGIVTHIDRRTAALAELVQSKQDLERLFQPKRGIAIVGRVDTSPAAMKWLSRIGGDVRFVFVNPKGGESRDYPVYRSILEVPDYVDLAIIKVGAATVASVVSECGQRGIKDAVIFSTGFSEVGPEGAALEAEVARAAKLHGVRVIGPNTNDNTFEQFPIPENHHGGLIALITQSGFNGRPLVEGINMGVAFKRWVTVGNEADLELADFINYFAHDPDTAVIAAYVEGFKSADKLRLALEAANRMHKPVIMLKIGATERGAKMAASHTGHLVGADAIVEGLFRQYGVTRVRDLDELLETANLFAKLAPDSGTNCALYSVSGGSTTLMAELAESYDVPFPELTAATVAKLRQHIPSYLSVSNPIDNGGVLIMTAPTSVRLEVLDDIASDPNVDIVVIGVTAALGMLSDGFSADALAWAPKANKPMIAVWGSILTDSQGYRDLVKSGIPIFRSFRKCFRALKALRAYQAQVSSFRVRETPTTQLTDTQRLALSKPGIVVTEDASALLRDAKIALVADALVQSAEAAVSAADAIGYPVAMKLMSPSFPHKSDVGLVMLSISNRDQVTAAYKKLQQTAQDLDPNADIEGILIQQQIGRGVELILGLTQDPQFGPALTIGAGGIYAEILKDVVTRPLPVDRQDVHEMLSELRISALLDGARGAKPVDREKLVDIAIGIAELGIAAGPLLDELDLNPVVASAEGTFAVDSLLVAGRV